MKYYLIPNELAIKLNVVNFRHGNAQVGYIVSQSDIAVMGEEAAKNAGAKEVSTKEAETIIKKIKKA